jgi:hypothetical protein
VVVDGLPAAGAAACGVYVLEDGLVRHGLPVYTQLGGHVGRCEISFDGETWTVSDAIEPTRCWAYVLPATDPTKLCVLATAPERGFEDCQWEIFDGAQWRPAPAEFQLRVATAGDGGQMAPSPQVHLSDGGEQVCVTTLYCTDGAEPSAPTRAIPVGVARFGAQRVALHELPLLVADPPLLDEPLRNAETAKGKALVVWRGKVPMYHKAQAAQVRQRRLEVLLAC